MKDVNKKVKSGRHLVSGFILLGLGIYFQLWSMDVIPDFDKTWPAFIIIVGLALIFGAFFRKNQPDKNQQVP